GARHQPIPARTSVDRGRPDLSLRRPGLEDSGYRLWALVHAALLSAGRAGSDRGAVGNEARGTTSRRWHAHFDMALRAHARTRSKAGTDRGWGEPVVGY